MSRRDTHRGGGHVQPRRGGAARQLCRYIARPPLAKERVESLPDGRVRIALKRAWSDGTTALELSRLELVERLVALVPDRSLGRTRCIITGFWRLVRGFGRAFDRRHGRRRRDRRRSGGGCRDTRRDSRAGGRGVLCSGGSLEWWDSDARSAVMRCSREVAG